MNQYLINSKNGKLNIIEGKNIINPKAIILNIHGVGSHFQPVYNNLDEFVLRDRWFSKFNYMSTAFEFHGHGKSEGIRCMINNFDDLIDDLDVVIKHLNVKFNNKNIFICAESMGGAVIIKYILQRIHHNIKGVILLSPLCGIDDHLKPNKLILNLLYYMSYLLPRFKLAFTTRKMSSETVINQDYIKAKELCPYGYIGSHRLCTVRELLNVSLWIPNNITNFNVPLLLFHGLCDKITTLVGSQQTFNSIQNNNKEMIILPNSEHNLLVENNPDDLTPNFIYVKILKWFDTHLV